MSDYVARLGRAHLSIDERDDLAERYDLNPLAVSALDEAYALAMKHSLEWYLQALTEEINARWSATGEALSAVLDKLPEDS